MKNLQANFTKDYISKNYFHNKNRDLKYGTVLKTFTPEKNKPKFFDPNNEHKKQKSINIPSLNKFRTTAYNPHFNKKFYGDGSKIICAKSARTSKKN